MRILHLFWVVPMITYAYPFCPKCVHSTPQEKVTQLCNLFKAHPLFKDRVDVDSIGKEICGEKGKYFLNAGKPENNHTNIFKGKFNETIINE